MFPYFLIYFSTAILAYSVRIRSQSRALLAVFCVLLVFFVGTRVEVGCDYGAYLSRFLFMYQGIEWKEAIGLGEGGFHFLNLATHDLGYPFNFLLFICALIFTVCVYRFASLAPLPLAFLALSFPVLFVQLSMSGLRQALGTAFLLLAFRSFVYEKRFFVILWVVVASQFHTSAIIFLPMVFLVGRNISALRLLLALILIGPVVAYFLQDRLGVYSDRYLEQIYGENSSSGAWLRYLLILLPFLVYQWKSRRVAEHYPQLNGLIRLFAFISFALFPIGLLSSVALHRLVFYVMPVSILALLIVSESVLGGRNGRVGQMIPFLAYGAYIVVWFTSSSHAASCYVPYQSWLT